MDEKKIFDHINEFIQEYNLNLHEVKLKNFFGKSIIQILVYNDEIAISTDQLEKVHKRILQIDKSLIPDNYSIEVSSLGLEREIVEYNDYERNLGNYIYLKSDFYKGEGYLVDLNKDEIILMIDKNKNKNKIKIPFKAISFCRKAVKV